MKKIKKVGKKTLSVLLSLLMVISIIPITLFSASAAVSVGATKTFTLSPNGNRGNDATETSWHRLALTGESSAGGTSIAIVNFDSAAVAAAAVADEIQLKFYSYSCKDRLITKSGTNISAEVYYATQNEAFIDAQSKVFNGMVADSGNTILGTNYSGTGIQERAKSYFGLSDTTKIASYPQPTIDGQSNSSLRQGTANYSYDVTDIVKERAAAGQGLSIVMMLNSSFSCNGTTGWSDIYYYSDSFALAEYTGEDLTALENAINAYETAVTDGRFYKNVANAYRAYEEAKRYYDATVYGGYKGSSAASYATTLQNAVNTMKNNYNTSFIDWCSNSGLSSVSSQYKKNVIWYPWNFSWNITTSSSHWTLQNVVFKWSVPNVIIGITDNPSETTFPLHQFFYDTSGNYFVRYIIAGSGYNGNLVGSSDFSTAAPWKVGTTTHTTSGFSAGSDGYGQWMFESSAVNSKQIDNFESSDENFGPLTRNQIYQASSYAKVNNSINVNANNVYKKIDFGYTWGTSVGQNSSSVAYGTHFSSQAGMNGYLYAVYMGKYNKYYKTPTSTLLPGLSYKNYNGYAYSNGQSVATELDYASNYSLNHGLNDSHRSASIDSTVQQWATNINGAASSLESANNSATTKITNKYVDLTNAIAASDTIYKSGGDKYTYASWLAFTKAYEEARADMAALSPAGTNEHYSTDSNEIAALANALNSARNGLTAKVYDLGYENLFSLGSWISSASSGNTDEIDVSFNSANGTITISSKATNAETIHSKTLVRDANNYSIPVVNGKEYTIEYTTNSSATSIVSINFYNESGNAIGYGGYKNEEFSVGTHSHTVTAPFGAVLMEVSFGAANTNAVITFSDIAVYQPQRAGQVAALNKIYRKVVEPGAVIGPLNEPVRDGYRFDGWFSDENYTNQVTEYTIAEENMVLYSKWTKLHKIQWLDYNGTLIKEHIIPNGETPVYDGETPVRESNSQYTYTFAGWNSQIVPATQDASYYATYSTELNKYTVIWLDEDGTVLETDTDVPYGTTPSYDGEEPSKESNVQYSYAFNGWTPQIVNVTGDATYTAVYSESTNSYTVTWIDGDGNTLKTDAVLYGETPVYLGETPTKTGNAQYSYVWNNAWDKEIAEVTGDVEYTATFDEVTNGYTVTWVNEDGTVLETDTDVLYGTTPTYDGETPVKDGNVQFSYTFNGWSPAVAEVTGNATYTAVYGESTNSYTVTWIDGDGNIIATDSVPYGTVPVFDGEAPTKARTLQYTYTWNGGWDNEVVAVTGDATYTATFDSTVNSYKLTFNRKDGTSFEIVCEYGTSKEAVLAREEYKGNSASHYDDDNHYSYKWDEYWETFTAVTKGNQTFNEIETADAHTFTPGYGNSYVQNEDGTKHIGTCDAGCGYSFTADHTGGTATCTSIKTCEICSLPYGTSLPHEYEENWTSDGAGNHYRQCTVCNKLNTRETVACTYPDAWTDSKDGNHSKTCTANGCGYMLKEAHDFSGAVEIVSKASCYDEGSKKIFCTDCTAFATETIAKRTHSMSDWSEVTAPTYTSAGEEIRYCQHTQADDEYKACTYSETQPVDMLIDATAPTGTIGYDENLWDEFLNTITFNNYINYDVTVEITFADGESGIKSAEYYISDEALSLEEVEAITSWIAYTDEVAIAKADTEKKVVYAKLTNNQNGITYLSTDGFTFDTTAPVIALDGVQNAETGVYCPNVTVTVTEENLAEVTLDETAIELSEGKYTVSAKGTYAVVVTDKAGNSAEVSFTIGHTPEAAVQENRVEATCMNKGSYDEVVYCSVCDEELSREEKEIEIVADAHDLEYVDGQLPTCDDFGWDAYEYCKREGCGYTTYAKIDASGHDYKDATATQEADNDAQHYYICNKCGVEKQYEDHSYSAWTQTQAPTYDNPGEKERECSVCNYIDTEAVPALSDSVAPVVNITAEKGNTETNVYCTAVTVTITEDNAYTVTVNGNAQSITDNAFTVSAEGTYTVVVTDKAGNSAEVSFTIGHTPEAAVQENRVEATCMNKGSYDEVVYCSVCDEELSREEKEIEIVADAHDLEYVDGQLPTCDDFGWDAYEYCKREGCGYTTYAKIDASGHDYEGVVTTEATCTEDGEKTYTCKNDASHTYTEVIAATGHKDENPADGKCDVCSEKLSECEHTNKETRNAKEASCIEEGYTGDIYCVDCKVLLQAGTSIPKAHAIEYIDGRESTCNSNGWKAHYACTVCRKTFSDREATTEIWVTLPTTEHNFGKWNRVSAPDCRSEDYEIRYCQNAGCGISDVRVLEGTRGAHSIVIVEGKEPTCLTPGKTAYKYCVSCNYVENSEEIPQLPHIDKNTDSICDMCSSKLYGSEACTCICHNDFFLAKLVYNILKFFWKLFGINKSCNCGYNHW